MQALPAVRGPPKVGPSGPDSTPPGATCQPNRGCLSCRRRHAGPRRSGTLTTGASRRPGPCPCQPAGRGATDHEGPKGTKTKQLGGGGAPRLRKPPGRLRAVRTPPSTGEEHPTTKSRRAPRGSEFSRSCVRRSSPAAVLRDLGAFVVQLCTRLGATALAEPVAHGSRPSAFSFPAPPPLPVGRGSFGSAARCTAAL